MSELIILLILAVPAYVIVVALLRRAVIANLAQEQSIEKVVTQFNHRSVKVVVKAVGRAGELKNPKATEPLIELLKHRSEMVRIAAACALGEVGDDRAVEPLRELLSTIEPDYTYYDYGQPLGYENLPVTEPNPDYEKVRAAIVSICRKDKMGD